MLLTVLPCYLMYVYSEGSSVVVICAYSQVSDHKRSDSIGGMMKMGNFPSTANQLVTMCTVAILELPPQSSHIGELLPWLTDFTTASKLVQGVVHG